MGGGGRAAVTMPPGTDAHVSSVGLNSQRGCCRTAVSVRVSLATRFRQNPGLLASVWDKIQVTIHGAAPQMWTQVFTPTSWPAYSSHAAGGPAVCGLFLPCPR